MKSSEMLEFAKSCHFFLASFPPYSCPKAQFLFYTLCNVIHFKMQVVYNTHYEGKNKTYNKPLLNVASHGPLKSFFSSFSCRRSYSETEILS